MMYKETKIALKICKFLREIPMKMINLKKKKMQLVTKEQQESYKVLKSVMFVKKDYYQK